MRLSLNAEACGRCELSLRQFQIFKLWVQIRALRPGSQLLGLFNNVCVVGALVDSHCASFGLSLSSLLDPTTVFDSRGRYFNLIAS